MLLKLYNLSHAPIGVLKNCKDLKVESVLSTGDKMLSFLWHQRNKPQIPHEYYIRTDTDEYVVKENSKASDGYRNIVAKLNLEDLEGRIFKEFSVKNHTALEAANMALTDTGWTCISTVPTSRVRSIGMVKASAYNVLTKILDAYTCEVRWDTLTKTVYLKERTGEDKGTYFISRLNLKEISDNADTYDYITRIIPTGAEGLDITSVNGGKEYLENYQYSAKKKTLYWEDSNYTDAQWLKEDAQYKLNELSKPKKTMQAKVIDLANAKPGYADLSYAVGDTVTLIDNETGIREKQRITKTINYLNAPEKNTCDISNTVLSFEELQKKLFAAAECIDNITTNNGTVKGSAVDKIDISQIKGFEHYIAESVDDFRANYIYARTEFGTPYAVIGSAILTSTSTTTLSVSSRAEIKTACVEELNAKVQQGDYAKFKVVESENISALEARIDKITSTEITTEYLNVNYAKINMANVDTATIRQGFLEELMVKQGIIADRVSAGTVIATDVLTGVNIYADDITAGTLSVDRLILRGTNKSLVYALNNSGNLVSTQVNTLDANILTDRTITASKIVAKSLTVTEIDVSNLRVNGFINANKMTAANIDVGNLFAQNITAAGSIQSSNYAYSSGNFSTNGIRLNMSTGQIISKKFAIDALGNAYFSGNITGSTITGGTINGGTINGGTINGTIIKSTSERGYLELSYGGITIINTQAGSTFGITVRNNTLHTSISVNDGLLWIGNHDVTNTKGTAGFMVDASNKRMHMVYPIFTDVTISNGCSLYVKGQAVIDVAVTTPTIYTSNWFRSTGATGWINNTYGGGWYMADTTWIRVYNSKKVFVNTQLSAGYVGVNYTGDVAGTGYRIYCVGETYVNGNITLGNGDAVYLKATNGTPYIGVSISSANIVYVSSNSVVTTLRGSTVYLKGTSTTVTSDLRRKDNIRLLNPYESFFNRLKPISFTYKKWEEEGEIYGSTSGRTHFGFGAQDVYQALVDSGFTTKDFAGYVDFSVNGGADELGIAPTEFIPLNTYMIQKTRSEVEVLRERVTELENQIELLKVS